MCNSSRIRKWKHKNVLLNLRLHNTQAKITQAFVGPVIGLFVYLGLMLKLPPLRSSVLHISGINSKTKVCSNGGVQKSSTNLHFNIDPINVSFPISVRTSVLYPYWLVFFYFWTNLGPILVTGQTYCETYHTSPK